MSIGVFIPGRLNSERLPNKLILPVDDSCLWDMACKKLNSLPQKYGKYALAYDQELIDIAVRYPNVKVIVRDKGTTEVDGPLNYVFKDVEKMEEKHLMFLNPCLSCLSVETILNALELFNSSGKDYMTSVKPFKNWLFNGSGEPLNHINYTALNTKEIDPLWQAAHCFHIFNREQFLKDGYMLKVGHLIIPVPEEETIDVDTLLDFTYVKFLFKEFAEELHK